uniref:Uncharacterized protein n=1 Tax=Rhizophora mucronata TaxID=61149 RepID=A0A2P2PB07_RHIMU
MPRFISFGILKNNSYWVPLSVNQNFISQLYLAARYLSTAS